MCTSLVRPGGHVANVGVHGSPATLHLETLWIRDVTVTTAQVAATIASLVGEDFAAAMTGVAAPLPLR